MMRTRAYHLAWCKSRAVEILGRGDLKQAFASMVSDLGKHPDTRNSQDIARDLGGQLLINGHLSTPDAMRRWIEGF